LSVRKELGRILDPARRFGKQIFSHPESLKISALWLDFTVILHGFPNFPRLQVGFPSSQERFLRGWERFVRSKKGFFGAKKRLFETEKTL
jgi:hypothetical protein